MENNKNKKSVKFQGDMLNFCDFIQVFVFTRNHHLKKQMFGTCAVKPVQRPRDLYDLTLKAPITIAADDIHKYFFIVFSEKIRQRIYLQHQALFSSKDKSEKLKCRLLQYLFGALRVKMPNSYLPKYSGFSENWHVLSKQLP